MTEVGGQVCIVGEVQKGKQGAAFQGIDIFKKIWKLFEKEIVGEFVFPRRIRFVQTENMECLLGQRQGQLNEFKAGRDEGELIVERDERKPGLRNHEGNAASTR